MRLQSEFEKQLTTRCGFDSGQRLLLAVSGGIDSVVLAHLCKAAGYEFIVLHCNFQLRGAESERDEQFVRDLAASLDMPCEVHKFDTAVYAEVHKMGIQEAARDLRYRWFEQYILQMSVLTRKQHRIATAHHADDNVETVLMNLFKGTGIRGLRGMKARNGNILRPLLFARKEELLRYAREHVLEFVEDSSNQTEDYTRNFFRNRVLPQIESVYPAASENILANIRRFSDVAHLYEESVQRRLKKRVKYQGGEVLVPVRALKSEPARAALLYEIIRPFGFRAAQLDGALSLLESESGKFMLSSTHRLLKDRERLILTPLESEQSEHVLIEKPEGTIHFRRGALSFQLQEMIEGVMPDADTGTALLDARLLVFPLLLRPWRTGDYFYPLGMAHKKKLSRFFIDQKLSLADKEQVWVLEMDRKIVWVVGMRIDNRFRVTPSTKQVLRIRFRSGVG